MKTYNGHKSYGYWNIALWIANDEPLYRAALHCLDTTRNPTQAAHRFIRDVVGQGARTPDGVVYGPDKVRAALAGLRD